MVGGCLRRVRAMVSRLQEHPGIEVLQVRIGEPAPAEVLAHLARVCAGGLPAGLADFYGELDGFFVDWVQTSAPDRPGAEPASGRINVRPAAEVFGPGPGRQFLDEDVRFRPVRPFDIFTSEACGAFLQGPDMAVADELHLHVFGEGTESTGHTAEAYLERALASRGLWMWLGSLCPSMQDSPEVADFRRVMPRLFDDYDDALFHPGPH